MSKWIEGKYRMTCSFCRATYPNDLGEVNFCPSCGSAMGNDAPMLWQPCEGGLPKELQPVNITWRHRRSAPYYQQTEYIPRVATAVLCKDKWYWWSCDCENILHEHMHSWFDFINDNNIEVIAWAPLPEPYIGE